MTNSIQRDQKRRILAGKFEQQRLTYKALLLAPLPQDLRQKIQIIYRRLPRNSSFTRLRNRCIQTGRGRAVYRKFRLSRLCFRNCASFGLLPGVYKSSW